MAGVERGLAAAGLSPREDDVVAGAAQKRLGVGDCVRQQEVAEAGGEELYAHAKILTACASSAPICGTGRPVIRTGRPNRIGIRTCLRTSTRRQTPSSSSILSPDWDDLDRRVERLGPPNVLLSVYWHARSAQGILDRYEGTRVFAHESARDEAAERVTFTDEFRAGDSLPGGVDVLETGMTGETIFFVPAVRALVAGDVLLGTADGGVRVCPDSWLDGRATPEGLRGALRAILELPIELVLLTHGQPVVDDAGGALERALR
jgi:hypothetical protein